MDNLFNCERDFKKKAIMQYLKDYFYTMKTDGIIKQNDMNDADYEFLAEGVLNEVEQIEMNFEFGE